MRALLASLLVVALLAAGARPATAHPSAGASTVDGPHYPGPAPLAAQGNPDQALLSVLRPEVQWSAVGAIRWQSVDGDQVVSVGDRVRTGPGAGARLLYPDGSATELGPETGLLVQRIERAPDGSLIARLFQSAGETVNRVLPAAAAAITQFEIETPAVFTRVRGTTPQVAVAPNGVTRVASIPDNSGGLVAVQGKDPAGTQVTLQPGEETTIAPGQPPAAPRAIVAACTTGFVGEYFDNPDLQGTPAVVRCDPILHFDWAVGGPAPAVPADGFSARWRGQLTLPRDGTYTFSARADDGIRLYVDGALVLDRWQVAPASVTTARRALAAGPHDLVVEYFDAYGDATLRVDWPIPPD